MMVILILILFAFSFSQPILGEADTLTYEKDRIIYTGNVKLTRGQGVLTADKVIIYLDENKKAKRAEAEGRVRYVEGKRRASADRAEYDFQSEVLKLYGNAKVEDGDNFVEADEITYYRKEDRAVATTKTKRVRTFYVEEKGEKARDSK